MILLIILSFIAGVLTVAAPCIFTLLPVIVGGTIARSGTNTSKNFKRPLIIAVSLAVSVILFTVLLKASSALLDIPSQVWQMLAGGIIVALGINFISASLWPKLIGRSGMEHASNKLLGKALARDGSVGDILTGAALGPVFSSCSPTYAFVVAAILPSSLFEGLVYLTVYAAGLAGILLVIGYAGQAIVEKLGWLADPNQTFRKVIGTLFIIIGVSIILGLDKKLEATILQSGILDGLLSAENSLRR